MPARLIARNMRQFQAELEASDKRRVKAGQTAAKVEGYRLRGVLIKELKQGAPGGHALLPLRVVTRKKKNRKPLAALAKGVRYHASGTGKTFNVEVGFLTWHEPGVNHGTVRQSRKSAGKTWTRWAQRQQEGYTTNANSTMHSSTVKKFWRWYGGKVLSKRSSLRKFFFLREGTKTLRTPARPIIDPFWRAHQGEAARNIINNFKLKLAGARI